MLQYRRIWFQFYMLSRLISESQTIIHFPLHNESYSVRELINNGSNLKDLSETCGCWNILPVENTPSSVARLLWILSEELDVLLVSSNIPDNTLLSIRQLLQDDDKTYQSLPRLGLLTSGTTGTPKIVIHDAMRIYSKCILNDKLIYSPRSFDNVLCALSLSFGHGLIGNFLSSLVSCNSCTIINNDIKSLIQIPSFIAKYSVNFMSSVPSMWKVIPANRISDASSMVVGIGSSYLSSSLATKLMSANFKSLINFYGLTELSNWIGYNEAIDDVSSLYDNTGNAKFKLYDDVLYKYESTEADNLSHGELALKHSSMLLGYLGHLYPATSDSFYLTSDIFKACENGYITMLGRNKFYVKRGGHRIHLTQIDSLISSLNLGFESVTVNSASDYREDAFIVTLIETEKSSDVQVVKQLLSESLVASSFPNDFKFIDQLPKTQRGKIDYPACEEYARNA